MYLKSLFSFDDMEPSDYTNVKNMVKHYRINSIVSQKEFDLFNQNIEFLENQYGENPICLQKAMSTVFNCNDVGTFLINIVQIAWLIADNNGLIIYYENGDTKLESLALKVDEYEKKFNNHYKLYRIYLESDGRVMIKSALEKDRPTKEQLNFIAKAEPHFGKFKGSTKREAQLYIAWVNKEREKYWNQTPTANQVKAIQNLSKYHKPFTGKTRWDAKQYIDKCVKGEDPYPGTFSPNISFG